MPSLFLTQGKVSRAQRMFTPCTAGLVAERRTVPSWFSVCFIAHAFTSHIATTLPAAVASRPFCKKTTAFTCQRTSKKEKWEIRSLLA
jgi:hypothetical protein